MKTFYEILNIFSKSVKIFAFTFVVCGTMLMFVSCGETPNDEPEQYCEGVQNENHDHCKEPGCVLDEHTGDHDYCKEQDCDGSNHMGKAHPAPVIDQCVYCEDGDNTCVDGSECYAGGKVISLGENYQAFDAMNGDYFNNYNQQTKIDSLNTFKTRYEKYVNGLINGFSDEFKTKYNIDNINFRTFEYDRNGETHVDPQDAIFDSEIEQLNDVCAPAIEEITKNICITSGNTLVDKAMFKLYYRAIANYIYGRAYNNTNSTYTTEKANIEKVLGNVNNANSTSYSIYNQDGAIHEEALQRFDQMITKAADRLNIDVNVLRKIVNLSFMPTTLKGMHDCMETKIDHTYNKNGTNTACPTSEMVDVIENVKVVDMVAQAKLNKSIFSQDCGRELC